MQQTLQYIKHQPHLSNSRSKNTGPSLTQTISTRCSNSIQCLGSDICSTGPDHNGGEGCDQFLLLCVAESF